MLAQQKHLQDDNYDRVIATASRHLLKKHSHEVGIVILIHGSRFETHCAIPI